MLSSDSRATKVSCPACLRLTRVPAQAQPGELVGVEITLKFKCSTCGSRLFADEALVGFTVPCSHCGSSTTVPEWTRPEERRQGSPPAVVSKTVLTPAEIEFLTSSELGPPGTAPRGKPQVARANAW